MRVLAIAGSLRAESDNRRLLEAARGLGTGIGVEVEILGSAALRSLPHFDEDIEADPGRAVAQLRAAIEAADALLVATPEYNSTIPGALKNAVDWASRPRGAAALENKPTAVIGASAAPFGAVWAQAELRKALGSAGARVLEAELAVGTAQRAFGEGGELRSSDQAEELASILAELRAEAAPRAKALAA